MQARFNFGKAAPDAYKAVAALEQYVQESGLDKRFIHLIKLRASQINGCAYCVDMHSKEARHHGLSEQWINLMCVWRESPVYDARERALLAWVDAVTKIAETGTRINLNAMPAEAVVRCRAAWARLAGHPTCVVHGNPNSPANVRMTADRVALIDWDETHVDVPDLDLGSLPYNAAGLDGSAFDIAAQASAAWEAAICWDDDYSIKRLAEVRPV